MRTVDNVFHRLLLLAGLAANRVQLSAWVQLSLNTSADRVEVVPVCDGSVILSLVLGNCDTLLSWCAHSVAVPEGAPKSLYIAVRLVM